MNRQKKFLWIACICHGRRSSIICWRKARNRKLENFLGILAVYYMFVFASVGVVGGLAISLCGEVYEMEDCLKNKKDFIHCILMYEYAVAILLDEYGINKAGIVIVEILTILSVWFLNVLVFAILCFLLLLKGICYLFWIAFRKRDDGNE